MEQNIGRRLAEGLLEEIQVSPRVELRVVTGNSAERDKLGTAIKTRGGNLQAVTWPELAAACEAAVKGNEVTQSTLVRAQQVLRAFIGSGLLASTDPAGVGHLFGFCLRAALDPEVAKDAVVSVGIGGSTDATLLRFPVYLLPGAQLLEDLARLNLPLPTFRIFSGQMAGVEVNRFNPDVLWPNTLMNFAYGLEFLRRFFPQAARQVVFDFDRPIEEGHWHMVKALTRAFKDNARGSAQQALAVLRQRGVKHGGEDGSLTYAALHPLMFGDILPQNGVQFSRYLDQVHTNQDRYWFSIGGPPEYEFNLVRSVLHEGAKEALGREVVPTRSIRLLTPLGQKPVYYQAARDEVDPPLTMSFPFLMERQVLKKWEEVERDPFLKKDWDVLYGVLGDRLGTGKKEEIIRKFIHCAWGIFFFFDYASEFTGRQGLELLAAAMLGNKVATSLIGEEPFQMLARLNQLPLTREAMRAKVQEARNEFLGLNNHTT